MILIGLCGSTDRRRDAVATKVVEAKLARLVTLALETPAPTYPRAGVARARRLLEVADDARRARFEGVVFSRLKTLEEADQLRALGGEVWHIEGVPSADVPIRLGDLLVTATDGGHRHYLDPLEAFSETVQRLRARAAA